VSKIRSFEKDLYAKLDNEKNVVATIQKEKALSDETIVELKKIIEEVVSMY
jgi:F0F1-type ATP synthase alpha subunit